MGSRLVSQRMANMPHLSHSPGLHKDRRKKCRLNIDLLGVDLAILLFRVSASPPRTHEPVYYRITGVMQIATHMKICNMVYITCIRISWRVLGQGSKPNPRLWRGLVRSQWGQNSSTMVSCKLVKIASLITLHYISSSAEIYPHTDSSLRSYCSVMLVDCSTILSRGNWLPKIKGQIVTSFILHQLAFILINTIISVVG